MHPLVQQHAAAQLAAQPARRPPRAAPMPTTTCSCWRAFRAGRWTEQPAFFAEMDPEFENLRAAWTHAVATGMAGHLAAATIGLASQCHARTRWDDGLALLAAAEPLLQADPAALAQLQCSRALLPATAATTTRPRGWRARPCAWWRGAVMRGWCGPACSCWASHCAAWVTWPLHSAVMPNPCAAPAMKAIRWARR